MTSETTTTETPELLAFRAFGQEADHLSTVNAMLFVNNFSDAAGFQETADKALDLGWQTLEDAGWRHCRIAQFRHAAHERWRKEFPLPVLNQA